MRGDDSRLTAGGRVLPEPGGPSAAPGYERPDVDGTRLPAILADFLRM
jgi:hypothetical protein